MIVAIANESSKTSPSLGERLAPVFERSTWTEDGLCQAMNEAEAVADHLDKTSLANPQVQSDPEAARLAEKALACINAYYRHLQGRLRNIPGEAPFPIPDGPEERFRSPCGHRAVPRADQVGIKS